MRSSSNQFQLKYAFIRCLFSGISAGVLAIGGYLMAIAGAEFSGTMTMLLAGISSITFLGLALDRRSRLTIDRRGITDRGIGIGFVPWSHIKAIWIQKEHGIHYLCYHFRKEETHWRKLSPFRRFLCEMNRAKGLPRFSKAIVLASSSPTEIAEFAAHYCNLVQSLPSDRTFSAPLSVPSPMSNSEASPSLL